MHINEVAANAKRMSAGLMKEIMAGLNTRLPLLPLVLSDSADDGDTFAALSPVNSETSDDVVIPEEGIAVLSTDGDRPHNQRIVDGGDVDKQFSVARDDTPIQTPASEMLRLSDCKISEFCGKEDLFFRRFVTTQVCRVCFCICVWLLVFFLFARCVCD